MTGPASSSERTEECDANADRRVVRSDDLFARAREVVIVHGRHEYRLRITRAGKLILTK